jgi:aquaporin NIP
MLRIGVLLMKKYTAEFIGTFALVFTGTGAIITDEETKGTIGHLGVATTFGLIVMVLIYTFGRISGAHFNPAVTCALTVTKKFDFKKMPGYWAAQLLGAILASATLRFLFPYNSLLGATMPAGSELQSFLLEYITTLLLMIVVFAVSEAPEAQRQFNGLVIGAVICLEAIFAGPISGASMNPFRSLAPAIVSGHFAHLWIYMTAPFAGALSASIFANLLLTSDKN